MLNRTALFEEHRRLGGRLIDFGGWELPVQYSGVMEEHTACRERAGIFDVSHMGEFHVEGPDAEAFLDHAVTNNVAALAVGQAQYTVLCHPSGGIVDDLVIYRRAADRFLVVVNASNTAKDFDHLKGLEGKFKGGRANLSLTDESRRYTQIALQGRLAQQILSKFTSLDLSAIRTYWFAEGDLAVPGSSKVAAIVARTGYTGEDGFEIYVRWEDGPAVWRALVDAGTPLGLKPCGLGARDTLRMEMKYPLYGHELSDETNPLEAGLGWVVKLAKPDFVGKTALVKAKEAGLKRKLVGLELSDRGIPRQDYPVWAPDGERPLGIVTSGTQSPSLGKSIGIAYVDVSRAEAGSEIQVEIRGKRIPGRIVPTPFYKRPY